MINFFRNVLDGPLYIVIVIFSVIFLMAIFGFIMERKKFEREEKAKVAVISNPITFTPGTGEPQVQKSSNAATAEVSNFINFDTPVAPTSMENLEVPQVLEISSTPVESTNPVSEIVLNSESSKKE